MSKIYYTPRQKKLYDYINKYIIKNKYPPTYSEIQKHMKYKNVGTVAQMLYALKDKGYIDLVPGVPRSINIIHND